MLAELQHQVAGKILDRRDRVERFLQTVADEPFEGGLLQLDEIGELQHVGDLRERIAAAFRTGILGSSTVKASSGTWKLALAMFCCLIAVPDPFGAAGAASLFLRLRVVLGLSAVVFVAILFLGSSCVGSRASAWVKREKATTAPPE